MTLLRLLPLLLLSAHFVFAGSVEEYGRKIATLLDPAKLATLRTRGANPRIQKSVYWLWQARQAQADPGMVIDFAMRSVAMTNALAMELTKAALLRNLTIAERLGCLDDEGLAEMRKGKSPTVHKGPYKWQELSVDHIIPRAVAPELDNVIANLELMPLRLNESKSASVGQRQRDLATKFRAAGLLSNRGFDAVMRANDSTQPRRPNAK